MIASIKRESYTTAELKKKPLQLADSETAIAARQLSEAVQFSDNHGNTLTKIAEDIASIANASFAGQTFSRKTILNKIIDQEPISDKNPEFTLSDALIGLTDLREQIKALSLDGEKKEFTDKIAASIEHLNKAITSVNKAMIHSVNTKS